MYLCVSFNKSTSQYWMKALSGREGYNKALVLNKTKPTKAHTNHRHTNQKQKCGRLVSSRIVNIVVAAAAAVVVVALFVTLFCAVCFCCLLLLFRGIRFRHFGFWVLLRMPAQRCWVVV